MLQKEGTIRGHGNSFGESAALKVKANICHLLNTNFIQKIFGSVIRDGRNTSLKNVSCAVSKAGGKKTRQRGAGVGVGGEEVTHFFSSSFALLRSTVIYTLLSSFSKDEGGISQRKKW